MTTKKRNIELDVDSIGTQEPITKSEEKLLSDYFQKRQSKKSLIKRKKKEIVKK